MTHTDNVSSANNKMGAIITGAARRLGMAMSIFLAKHGYDIVAHYNSSHQEAINLQATIHELYQRKCFPFQSDLQHFPSLKNLVEYAFSVIPYCNILINNASIFYPNTLMQSSEQDFDRNYHIHVRAPMFITQHFAQACPQEGSVINIIDARIVRNQSRYFTYILSKKSLADFTKLAASELAPKIRVNAICPSKIPDDEILQFSSSQHLLEHSCLKHFLHQVQLLLNPNNDMNGEFLFL